MKFPREKFNELSKGKPSPYCFEIRKRNQVLFYFGANHSHDPKNRQYPILKKYWAKFLATANPLKLLVVENGLRRLEPDEKTAIRRGSEGSFATLLAYDARIPVISPEPTKSEIIAKLRKKFKEDTVQYYEFAYLVDSWSRQNPRPPFEKWMKQTMDWDGKQYGFEQFTLPRLKAIHRKIFHWPFDYKNHFFNSVTNPNSTDTSINKIAGFLSDIRDSAVIKALQTEWRKGRSLFVVYGSGHAFIQEAILKQSLQ